MTNRGSCLQNYVMLMGNDSYIQNNKVTNISSTKSKAKFGSLDNYKVYGKYMKYINDNIALTLPSTTIETIMQSLEHESSLFSFDTIINEVETNLSDIPREIFCYETMHEPASLSDDTYLIEVFKASADPDILYYYEAMRCDDRVKFCKVMNKELIF